MSASVKPSKSNPQYANMLRKIMLVDAIIKARNADYQKQLDEFFKKSPTLTAKERDEVTKTFTRTFYREETEALATYEAIKKRHSERIDPTFSGTDAETLEKERYILAMGAEAYVGQALFSDSAFKSLSEKYPQAAEQLKREIRKESSFFKNDYPPSAAHWPATVSLFNKRYPKIQQELESMQKNPDGPDNLKSERKGLAAAALTMLKVGSAAANPSGFLISKAIGGLLQTKAMQPLVSGVTESVKRVAQNSGLVSAVKTQFSKLSTTQRVAIAGAIATVGVSSMVMLGLVDADKGLEYAHNIISSAKDIGEIGLGNAQEIASQAYDSVSSKIGNTVDWALGSDGINQAGSQSEQVSGDYFEKSLTQESYASQGGSTTPEAPETPSNAEQSTQAHQQTASPEQIANELNGSSNTETAKPEAIATPEPATPGNMTAPATNYRIMPGDTLSEIIESRLQQAGLPYDYNTIDFHVRAAAEFNGISDPNLIYSGKTITLPEISGVKAMVSPDAVLQSQLNMTEPPAFEPKDWNALLNSPLVEKEDPVAQALTDALSATHAFSAQPEPHITEAQPTILDEEEHFRRSIRI